MTFEGEGLNEAKKIRIAVQPGNFEVELNKELQYIEETFAEYGVEVEFNEFTYGPPMIESLAAKETDDVIRKNS